MLRAVVLLIAAGRSSLVAVYSVAAANSDRLPASSIHTYNWNCASSTSSIARFQSSSDLHNAFPLEISDIFLFSFSSDCYWHFIYGLCMVNFHYLFILLYSLLFCSSSINKTLVLYIVSIHSPIHTNMSNSMV
ncbi:unnamed protein product [Cuscuta epithymum]|uniref:Secreted protein n=1 Tax=Cuscuta epithymum TaxID=186058 RepID=A0AAV0C9G5_9ASTE|nr:unnamed protein product [Cuscuta epithymum]